MTGLTQMPGMKKKMQRHTKCKIHGSLRASAKRERVLRGLVEKSEHERPGPARDDAFWSLISLQPRDRLTSGFL